MGFEQNKTEVLNLFENHILKYIVKDLEVLDNIRPDTKGLGGCAIPQAIATFAALDLIGYLVHPDDLKDIKNPVFMSFSDFLRNPAYFPEFVPFSKYADFYDSFRDNVRSIMTHRFLLAKYDITKTSDPELFFIKGGSTVFNVSFLTQITINVIKKIYQEIKDNKFRINGFKNEESIKKIQCKIESLKLFEGKKTVHLINVPSPKTTSETTQAITSSFGK